MERLHPNLGRPSWGRRRAIYQLGAGVVGLIAVCWVLILVGVLPPTPTDVYVSAVVLPVLFFPFFAFWDNPGESRTRLEKLSEFGFLWLLISGVTQTTWELPWFFVDTTGHLNGVTAADRWAWLWWAYGGADTRYITSNPTIAGLEFMAGFSGLLELYGWYLYRFGTTARHRIAGCWIALCVCVGLTYLTGSFFVSEWHVGWAHIQQGAMGFWLKFVGLNLPWLVAPIFCIPAAILEIGHLHRAEGRQAALAERTAFEDADRRVRAAA